MRLHRLLPFLHRWDALRWGVSGDFAGFHVRHCRCDRWEVFLFGRWRPMLRGTEGLDIICRESVPA
jgi:hypothetical protein